MKIFLFNLLLIVFVLSLSLASDDVDSILKHKVKRSANGKRNGRSDNRPVKDKGLLEREENHNGGDVDCDTDDEGVMGSFQTYFNKLKKKMRNLFGYSITDDDDEDVDEPETESFYERFIGSWKPWWNGPNVCKSEDEKKLKLQENGYDIFSMFQTSSCVNTGKSYRCSMKTKKNNTNFLRTLTYECCHGYARQNGQKGCPKKLDLKPLPETLESLNLTRFHDVLQNVDISVQLMKPNYTIFVPNNNAIDNPQPQTDVSFIVSKTNDKLHFIRDILSAHVLKKNLDLDRMEDEQRHESLKANNFIRINFYSYPKPFVTANCARITSFDNQMLNGYIHVVDRVLPQASQTLREMLEEDPRFNVFTSLMNDQTKNILSSDNGHYTVMAFTDEAFEKLPFQTKERFKAKSSCITDIIKQHVIPHTICSLAIQNRAQASSLNGQVLLMNRSNGDEMFVNGIRMTALDRMATNGVLHVIDGVITYPQNSDTIESLDLLGYGELAAEFRENDLHEEIGSLKRIGLFLPPTNLIKNITSLKEDEKRSLLLNHVVENAQLSPYRRSTMVRTQAGTEYFVSMTSPFSSFSFTPPKRTIGCATFVKQSLPTCNGVIRFIDRILPIPKHDLMEILRSRPDLSVFTTMIEAAGLDQDLTFSTDEEAFTLTVFAPDNEAIERNLDAEAQRKLLNDINKLKSFVKGHFVKERICCHQMESESWLDRNTLETESQTVLRTRGVESEEITVGDSKVKLCNIEGTNGLVHIIDRPFPARRRFFSFFGN